MDMDKFTIRDGEVYRTFGNLLYKPYKVDKDGTKYYRFYEGDKKPIYKLVGNELVKWTGKHVDYDIKTNCECGGKYTYKHKSRHLKSLKHQMYLQFIS